MAKLYDSLENVNNISESARKLFLAVLAACLYSWLTIATTTDVNLITNRASSPLPIIQTSIPIVGFYWVAPLLLLCVYFYFHFYLQKLWEELGSLPAILPDGRPLHTKIDPWLLNDLVRAHLPKLSANRPFLSYLQLWISVLLAWWVVPITMFLFWGRYLPRHERTGTTIHVALLVISLTAAWRLYRLAVRTLRGDERKPFTLRGLLTSRRGYQTAAFAAAVGVMFGVVSWGARWGVPSNAPILGVPLLMQRGEAGSSTDRLTWVPRLMALVGYSPFANLTNGEVSQKKPTWSKNDKDPDSVAGAQLEGANLRYALASKAFLAGADLRGADLSYADLFLADLSGARLTHASLGGADLDRADLSRADLLGATLSGSHLPGANLSGAELIMANLSRAELDRADLSRAKLDVADLSRASLSGVILSGADLSSANLVGTILSFADLRDADLDNADLTYCVFVHVRNLPLETVKRARHWDKAFYDGDIIRALELPTDQNSRLAGEQWKEKKLQQRQTAKQTAPSPAAP